MTDAVCANGARRKTVIITISAIFVMLLWGSLFPSVQLGYSLFGLDKTFPPDLLLFAGVRFGISGSIITTICLCRRKNRETRAFKSALNRKALIGIAVVGMSAVVAHYACTYIALGMIDSSKAALLKQSGVLVFVCFSFLFVKEDKFSVGKLIGGLLGFASIVAVNMNAFEFEFGWGSVLVVSAGLCTVISNIAYKKLLDGVDPLISTGLSQLFGGIVLVAVGLSFGGRLNDFSWGAAGLSVYIIVATVVSYSLWYSMVLKQDLSKLFIIKMSEPLFSALIAFLFAQCGLPIVGKLSVKHLIAFVLIAAAVVVSNVKFKKNKGAKHPDDAQQARSCATEKNNQNKSENDVYESNVGR